MKYRLILIEIERGEPPKEFVGWYADYIDVIKIKTDNFREYYKEDKDYVIKPLRVEEKNSSKWIKIDVDFL